jgi:hypothetical protein
MARKDDSGRREEQSFAVCPNGKASAVIAHPAHLRVLPAPAIAHKRLSNAIPSREARPTAVSGDQKDQPEPNKQIEKKDQNERAENIERWIHLSNRQCSSTATLGLASSFLYREAVTSQSPGLRGFASYPGLVVVLFFYREAVASIEATRQRRFCQHSNTQGSSQSLATLGSER